MTTPTLTALLDEIDARAKAATHEGTALYCDGAYGFKTNRVGAHAEVFVAYPISTDCTAVVLRLVAAMRLVLDALEPRPYGERDRTRVEADAAVAKAFAILSGQERAS